MHAVWGFTLTQNTEERSRHSGTNAPLKSPPPHSASPWAVSCPGPTPFSLPVSFQASSDGDSIAVNTAKDKLGHSEGLREWAGLGDELHFVSLVF